jgi:hypothetical protein
MVPELIVGTWENPLLLRLRLMVVAMRNLPMMVPASRRMPVTMPVVRRGAIGVLWLRGTRCRKDRTNRQHQQC